VQPPHETPEVEEHCFAQAMKEYEKSGNPYFMALPLRERELIILIDLVKPLCIGGPEEVLDVCLDFGKDGSGGGLKFQQADQT